MGKNCIMGMCGGPARAVLMVIFTDPSRNMVRTLRIFILALAFICTASLVSAQFYNGSNQQFGKNRIQYRGFLWQYMKFDHYSIYFYEGSENLAEYTARVTPSIIKEVEDDLDFVIQEDIIIVVYKTQSDFKQSNVGLDTQQDANVGGNTQLQSNKLFVYFEGDYEQFKNNIRKGIAQIGITQLMLGSNWREALRNSTLLNLPEWYTEGIVSYLSDEWSPEMESIVRDGILSDRFRKFNRLTGLEARYAGQYMWRYIAEVYGENVIPNILYMARMSRNIDNGFLFVLGTSLKSLSQEFITYYQEKYRIQAAGKQDLPTHTLDIKTRKNRYYSEFLVSRDGKYAIYTSNILGQYRVYLYDIEEGKRKKIHKAEHKLDRIVDRSYPVMAWHPSSRAFNFVVERKGMLMMYTYDIEEKKKTKREIFQLEKVLDMAYADDGRRMVFSGVKNGQSDLYLYYMIGNRQERLTNDVYDDLDPDFVNGDRGVIFSSNRPDDTLRTNVEFKPFPTQKDIFIYDLERDNDLLTRITDTPSRDEMSPAPLDSVRYTFLAETEDRILQRMSAVRDSAIAAVDTTIHYRYFSRIDPLPELPVGIIEYDVQPLAGRYAQLMYYDGRYQFLVGDVGETAASETRAEVTKEGEAIEGKDLFTLRENLEQVPQSEFTETQESPPRRAVDISQYEFITEDEDAIVFEKKVIDVGEGKTAEKDTIQSQEKAVEVPTPRNYNLNFASDHVVTQLNNNNFTQFYQPYTGPQNIYPGFSPLLSVGITDLFEDYKIVGGFRTSFNLRNSDFLLSFQNYKKRLDKEFFFFRQNNQLFGTFTVLEVQTYFLGTRLSWPLSEVLRLEGTLSYRSDRFSALSTNIFELEVPSRYQHQLGLKTALVFDNALDMGMNLRRGWRFKIWGEYYQDIGEFQRQFVSFSDDWTIPENSDFLLFGADFRHYQRIHRSFIWANRLAASTSVGGSRLVYYLGGVDNWLFRRVDNSLPISTEQNYEWQALASPMRGFWNNARNGNSFAVINSELRFPVFSYFTNAPIKSDFLQNFQIVGFADVGAAWTGPHPYSEENEFNEQEVTSGGGSVSVLIRNNREPIIYGYGVGLRSRLLGYFVRLDWAWGVDDGVVQPSVLYLSLNLDF